MSEEDQHLIKSRVSALQDAKNAEKPIRAELRKATQAVASRLDSSKSLRSSLGYLSSTLKERIRRVGVRKLEQSIDKTTEIMRRVISDAVDRELKAQMRRYEDLKLPKPSKKAIKAVRDNAIDVVMRRPFPGTSVSLPDRMNALRVRTEELMVAAISAETPEIAKKIDHMRRGTHDPKQRTRLPGGSVNKAINRILRAEQARAMREASLGLAPAAGVDYMYWALSPAHVKPCACEILAAGTGTSVAAELDAAGINPSSIDLVGLYTVGDYPTIPHPHCLCIQVPFIPKR